MLQPNKLLPSAQSSRPALTAPDRLSWANVRSQHQQRPVAGDRGSRLTPPGSACIMGNATHRRRRLIPVAGDSAAATRLL
jgi:hypothetical protein